MARTPTLPSSWISLRPASAPRCFQRRHCGGSTRLRDVRLAIDRGIVEHEFAVECDHAIVLEQGQRIDLKKLGIARAEGGVHAIESARDLLLRLAETETIEHDRKVGGRRSAIDVDQETPDRRRFCRGDFLDVHAAFRGEKDQRLARGNVMQDGGIELARNFGLLLDQDALDRIVADAHPENLARRLLRFVGSGGELDSAGLAALAGRHLRLDDARPDIGGRHGRFRRADAERAARHRNAGRRQNQRFCGVFLESSCGSS